MCVCGCAGVCAGVRVRMGACVCAGVRASVCVRVYRPRPLLLKSNGRTFLRPHFCFTLLFVQFYADVRICLHTPPHTYIAGLTHRTCG